MGEPISLRFDVTRATGSSQPQELAAWLFLPPHQLLSDSSRLIVCLPGGSYDKRYYHLNIPGQPGYSMAEHLAEAGHVVLSVDHWGVGESSRPKSGFDVTPAATAAANHSLTTEALARLRAGSLHQTLPALPSAVSTGIGHSMGGMLTVLQQAEHRSHSQIAILGKSMRSIDRRDFSDEARNAPRNDYGEYFVADRVGLRRAFYFEDVPDEVIAADEAAQVATPGPLVAKTNSGDVATEAAAKIDVPVFLGIGQRDTVAIPRKEPEYYPNSLDITTYILPRSAHCHNFASTRFELWDRVLRWIPTAV